MLLRLSIGDNGLPSERHLTSGEVHRYAYDGRGNILRADADAVEVRRGYTAWGKLGFDERDGRGVRHRFEALDLRETTYLGRFTVRYDRDPDGALRITTPDRRDASAPARRARRDPRDARQRHPRARLLRR